RPGGGLGGAERFRRPRALEHDGRTLPDALVRGAPPPAPAALTPAADRVLRVRDPGLDHAVLGVLAEGADHRQTLFLGWAAEARRYIQRLRSASCHARDLRCKARADHFARSHREWRPGAALSSGT